MLDRRGILVGILFVVVVCAPLRTWGQTRVTSPSGVRRSAPRPVVQTTAKQTEVESPPTSKVILNRTLDYPAPAHARTANPVAPTAYGEPEAYDQGAEEPAAWYATYADPSEPLGFSGARMSPAAPIDPAAATGFFDEEYYPIEEPLDPDGPAPAVSSGEWVRDGYWYTQQSAVYLNRSSGAKNSVILATELQATILPHNSPFLQIPVGLGWAPGLRSTLGRHIGRDARNRDHSIEFTFLGLTHWGFAGGLKSTAGDNLFTNIDPTFSVDAFNRSTQQTFDATSDFNSYELNYRIDRRLARDRLVYTRDSVWVRQAQPALLPAMFAGIRVVSINETLSWFAESDRPGTGSTGSYFVKTFNNMVGPQVGGEVFFERADWRFGVRGKTAAVVNWNQQSSRVRILDTNGDPLSPNRDESASSHDAAFVGEVNVIGSYHLRPNVALRCAWDMIWVSNLALRKTSLRSIPPCPPRSPTTTRCSFRACRSASR